MLVNPQRGSCRVAEKFGEVREWKIDLTGICDEINKIPASRAVPSYVFSITRDIALG